ncbi:MAG: hypothetical protein JKY65_15895 [Planctomycetes bacterium]|nr:hypothetical protein [Planctomycetota bacterium]
MDYLFVLGLFGFFAACLAAAFAAHNTQVNRQGEFKDFMRRLEGGVLEGRIELFGGSQGLVSGHFAGREVKVEVYTIRSGKSSVSRIRFSVRAPHALAAFTVRKTNVVNRVGRALGLVPHTPIGDTNLDQKFILSGSAFSLRQLFRESPKLEWCLDDLFRSRRSTARGHGFLELEARHGWITCERNFGSPRAIELIETVRSLSRVAALCERKEVQTKIKILGDRAGLAWSYGGAGARCPYCHDDVDLKAEDLNACSACRTIHHSDCLAEAGGCTVLGCSEAAPRRVSA